MAIDTLKISTNLQAKGMPKEQADELAEQMKEFATEGQVATKLDIEKLRTEIKYSQYILLSWMMGLIVALGGFLYAVLH